MIFWKYWGLMFIMLFSIFWSCVAGTTAIDFTLVGHIKGWKRIKYPEWLGGAIDMNRKYGYKELKDQHTHPQVLWFLLGSFINLIFIIGLIVGVWQFVNDVDAWVLWSIDLFLYLPTFSFLVFSKLYARKVFLAYVKNNNEHF